MAKFCTKCGKKLEDGEKCSCQDNEKVKTSSKSDTKREFDFNQCVNTLVKMIKGMFTKPVDTIKKYATSDNFIVAIIALCLNVIVSGLFVYCLANELSSALFGGYSSLLIGSSFEVSFMKTFLYGCLFQAVTFVVVALLIYGIDKLIFKSKIDFKTVLSMVSICSVFTLITTILSIICIYISIKVMFIIFIVASLFYLTYLCQGIRVITKIDDNKLAYVFVAVIVITEFIVAYILPKILF